MAKNPDADALIAYLNESPSPWHAVDAAARRLRAAGVPEIPETSPFPASPGGRGTAFFTVRGGSLAALRVPEGFSAAAPPPFHIVSAHTDSPGLRLKPLPAESLHGYRQWGVEIYGGALYNSWLDRDLGIAGRTSRVGTPPAAAKLIRLDEKPLRIPQLAIHLDRTVNEQGLILNAQKQLVPVTGQAHGPSLESLLEAAAGIPFPDMSFDLCLYEVTPARYGGIGDEFIHSGRLDNLAMCHAALSAFLAAPADGSAVQVAVLFDHEEVGSVSAQGAESNFLSSLLERAALALGLGRERYLALLPGSFLVSADMAHAPHPNYPDKHEPAHFPLMNKGPVIKSNAGLRYASEGPASARFQGFCRRAGVEAQNFLSRADLACGTTLGPGLSASLGVPAVDAGNAMLSMHSAREMCGADDHAPMIAVLREFLQG
jgi:aspartyl aminopeptidase